ncbi:type II toxin-antitoxin system VapC family toxin [Prosthecobacter sp.]|uniref:type II toxin-antitoxin system VapC family toxin n=1 Tax=Prosthecobacter sp. TaxID=1965333 RepID=UPI0037835A2D
MFVVLDTNHFRELREDTQAGRRLQKRLVETKADVFTCIVAVEESVQGWLSLLKRHPPGRAQMTVYARLQSSIEALLQLPILPFDLEAAATFERLRPKHPRIGTMDLKIAAICLAHDATLLTRNISDFQNIPNLHIENWLD